MIQHTLQLALNALEMSSPTQCGQSDKLYEQERQEHRAAIKAVRQAIADLNPAQAYNQRKANVLKEKTMHAQIRAQYEANPTLTIECRNTDPRDGYTGWTITTNPGWLPTFEYRIKGE